MKKRFTTKSIERMFQGKFSSATHIQLLWKGKESFETIFDAIKEAKRFICLQFYIFKEDETGRALSELLKEKSRQGVKVFLLHDHFGSLGTPRSFWKEMSQAGIRIRASHPFKWTAPFHYVHRDHRKLIVIDSKKAFTGGLNIANEYSGFHLRRRSRGWRDTGMIVEGPIVSDLFDTFEKSWKTWGGKKIVFKGNKEAVRRGVKVKLLVPGKSDVPVASYAGRAFFSRLLKGGVEIYTYLGEMLHAKTYLFDHCWSIIGSTNLDYQSLMYNDEGNIGILDSAFASKMDGIFEEDLKNSFKIDQETWPQRPLLEKMIEHFFALFRKRL